MSSKAIVDSVDWEKLGETSDYLVDALMDKYKAYSSPDELEVFLEELYSTRALKDRLGDDRQRILVASRGEALCGVLLMEWTTKGSVKAEVIHKPRRKDTLKLLLAEAITISGVWGFERLTYWIFEQDAVMIKTLVEEGFRPSGDSEATKALSGQKRILLSLIFERSATETSLVQKQSVK